MKSIFYFTFLTFLSSLMESNSEHLSAASDPPGSEPDAGTDAVKVQKLPTESLDELWFIEPKHINTHQQTVEQAQPIRHRSIVFRPPLYVPRLAKSYNNYDYDPFFNKKYLMPFDTRMKPVKLLAFKRNRILPRTMVTEVPDTSIVEKQSPYNDITDLWHFEP